MIQSIKIERGDFAVNYKKSMASGSSLISEASVKREFANNDLHSADLFYYDRTDSTNTRAKLYAESDEWKKDRNDTFFIARTQTGGRGRMGRSFLSDGRGIYMSYLFSPKESTKSALQYTARAAVIAARAIESLSDGKVMLKWVNDLYMSKKKVAGILAEGRFNEKNELDYMIIGIGVNVLSREFPCELSEIATDIESASGKRISAPTLAARIARGFLESLSAESLIDEYRSRSFLIGEAVSVIKPSGSYRATVLSIGDDASLVLRLEDGSEECLSSGEVSIRKTN